jgi:NifB/MoaA-like Fe-S oxidoreductase
VSLHSTDPELRGKMMGGDASSGLEALKELLSASIEVHLQVVSCPGLSDGEKLESTLRDVLVDYGTAASLGVVPVGMTSHISGDTIKAHDGRSSSRVLETIERYQAEALEGKGERMFFAADELYLMAGRDFPAAEDYAGFPQLENGIGMARKLIDEAHEYLNGGDQLRDATRGIITGMAGEPVIRSILTEARADVEVLPVTNRLFGSRVNVTSLLSGTDIIAAIKARPPRCREMLIPETMLREGKFLDDLSPEDVVEETGIDLVPVEVNGGALLAALGFKEKER